MEKEIKGFMLFTDQKEAICCLDDAEPGILFKALYGYAANGVRPTFEDKALMSLFCMLRIQIDRSQSSYEKRCRANRANALKRQASRLVTSKVENQIQPSSAIVSDGNPSQDKNKTKSKDMNNIDEEAVTSVINVGDMMDSFEMIWKMYGKPVGNILALREKWMQLTDDDRTKIMQYVPQYVASRPEVQYRKNFENFLSQRIWETEPIRNANIKVGIVLQDNAPNKYQNDESW